mmetsp:Transcript_92946/g.161521  ORF Transcript_92946/g.161521 Transcript_92946/m.161521 type:complete len:254 (-) Transcript_92946:7-768(-)
MSLAKVFAAPSCRWAAGLSTRCLAPFSVAPAALCLSNQRRHLHLHEHQYVEILKKYGVQVPRSTSATSVAEVAEKSKGFADELVIKSSEEEYITTTAKVSELAAKMLSPSVNTVMLSEKYVVKDEKRIAIMTDTASGEPLLVGSKVGGSSIQDIAARDPDAITKIPIDTQSGVLMDMGMDMGMHMGYQGTIKSVAARQMMALYKVFADCGCTRIEAPLCIIGRRVLVTKAEIEFSKGTESRRQDVFAEVGIQL